ncbi:hypothetical protein D3C72_1100100 [compost metagenome]
MRRLRRLQFVGGTATADGAKVHHARQVGHRVAAAHGVVLADVRYRWRRHENAVIEHDQVVRIGGDQGLRLGGTGRIAVGRHFATPRRQAQFAARAQIGILRHGQRLREAHEHAFHSRHVLVRQSNIRRHDAVARALREDGRHVLEFRIGIFRARWRVFDHRARHAHQFARLHGGGRRARVHEDAVRRRRIAIAGRILNEEAGAHFQGHHALGRLHGIGVRAAGTTALDLRDRVADGGQALHGHIDLARRRLLLVVAEIHDDRVISHRHASGHQQVHAGALARHAGRAEIGQADAGHGGRAQDSSIHDAIDVGSAQHGAAAIAHGQGQVGRAAGNNLVHDGAAAHIQRRSRIAWRHAAGGEVHAIVVRVAAAAIRARNRQGIRWCGCHGAFKTIGRAETDQVDDGRTRRAGARLGRLAIAQQHLARRARHGRAARRIRRRQRGRTACSLGLLDQQILARLQIDSRQGRDGPGRTGGGGVLHAPVIHIYRAGAAVENLDEIVGVQRPGIAAAAIHLADDEVGSGQGWHGQAGQHGGHDGQTQRRAQG